MNTTIIKGALRVGTSKAIKRYAAITGNRKLYVEALAGELLGKAQRSYGGLKDTRDGLVKTATKKAKEVNKDLMRTNKVVMKKLSKTNKTVMKEVSKTNKVVMKKVKKLHIEDKAKALGESVMKQLDEMRPTMPVAALAAVALWIITK